ncbi:acyl-CoA thioesterase [Mycolicibacterium sp.]|uniref:acyl-CoA thioesterase n=1 Tax=Mycolicibacterium sp. TaxID=2320850 RepID=UPI003D098674
MEESRSWIAEMLALDRHGDVFIAAQAADGPGTRLFGGLIAAQALAAAGATVEPAKRPHSFHLYFVRGGRYGLDVELHVERTRNGRAFDTRLVTAVQDHVVILEMIASFHRPEPDADLHPVAPRSLALAASVPKFPDVHFAEHFEIRARPSDESLFALPPFWIRTRDKVDCHPLVRACVLTFMSDLGPAPAARPAGAPPQADGDFAASLDHSVWFHRDFDPHEWHRYDVHSLNNSDSRGLVAGAIYSQSGSLIASTTQETLWRIAGSSISPLP